MLFVFLSDPFKFAVGDTTNFGLYENGGKVIEVKKAQIIHFVSFCFLLYFLRALLKFWCIHRNHLLMQ